ncbi:MAG TPA: hypothetical protein VJN88_13550 [Ktedonobacterales bacterium]|nr:hypothetical protein [Ktedonobacterales bacterium]
MGHVIELSDEQYQVIAALAQSQGKSLEDAIMAWAMDIEDRQRRANPTYYETDAWMRHLGASDEQIREAERLAALPENEEDAEGHGRDTTSTSAHHNGRADADS